MAEFQVSVIQDEDGPMLTNIDRYMAQRELSDMKPVVLTPDVGAMQARAVMKRLLKKEST